MALQKEWADGGSDCKAQGTWERAVVWLVAPHSVQQKGTEGQQTSKVERHFLTPTPTLALMTALLWPPAWPQHHPGDGDVRFWFFSGIWGFSGCQRILNLRGRAFHRVPQRKGQCLDYTESTATTWRVFSLDNNDIFLKLLQGLFSKSMKQPLCFLSKGEQK